MLYLLNSSLAFNFLRRGLREIFGFIFILSALAVAVALIRYDINDISFNTASDVHASYYLKTLGCYASDLMLQTIGIGAFIFTGIFLGWGIQLLNNKKFKLTLAKVMVAFLSMACLCVVVTSIPVIDQFSIAMFNPLGSLPHSGGFIGYLLYLPLLSFFKTKSILFFLMPTLCLVAFCAIYGFWFSLGFTFMQFVAVLVWLYNAVVLMSVVLGRFVYQSYLWCHRFSKNPRQRMDETYGNIEETSYEESHVTYENIDDSQLPDWNDSGGELNDFPSITEVDQTIVQKKSIVKNKKIDLPLHLLQSGEYVLPPLELLDKTIIQKNKNLSQDLLNEQARLLENVLNEFGISGEIVNIRPGPVVTMYELKPAPGIKTSRVIGLSDDIARSMSALSARIAVIPGQNVIGIELPNKTRQTVYLRGLLNTEDYQKTETDLPLILGEDIGGNPIIADLAKMPHLLVAGTTGSGKSVSVNAMILSLLFKLSPSQCKFIMIDPKMLELSVYDDIPHLLTPVVTDPKKAVVALKWAVKEMENRYRAMSKLGVRNIAGFNKRLNEARRNGEVLVRRVQTGFDPETGKPIFENQGLDFEVLPYIVVVVDEMADLMLVAGKEIEATIQRLAQMARAAGIHLIMATQRPSVDVITGTIKANFPTRISFQVTSKIDSRTILSEQGAEQLLGQGDMLFMAGGGRISRVHGPYVRDDEVERIVSFLKAQSEPTYIDGVTDDDEELFQADADNGKSSKQNDPTYAAALEVIRREGKVSTSFIQRHLQIGYNRAARIVDQMEKEGIISAANHAGKREILIS